MTRTSTCTERCSDSASKGPIIPYAAAASNGALGEVVYGFVVPVVDLGRAVFTDGPWLRRLACTNWWSCGRHHVQWPERNVQPRRSNGELHERVRIVQHILQRAALRSAVTSRTRDVIRLRRRAHRHTNGVRRPQPGVPLGNTFHLKATMVEPGTSQRLCGVTVDNTVLERHAGTTWEPVSCPAEPTVILARLP